MKIWYQSAAKLGIGSKILAYENSLKSHISSILDPVSTFSIHGIDSHAANFQDQDSLDKYRYDQFAKNAVLAESQGFNFFAIGCWKDYANDYIRKNTKLSVVSIAEASLHAALILGRRPAVIMPNARDESIVKENLKSYGIEQSKLLFTTFILKIDALHDAFANPASFNDHFMPCANKLIKDGADVIVAGHGVLNELLYRMGKQNIGDVIILDSIAALIAHAKLFNRKFLNNTLNTNAE